MARRNPGISPILSARGYGARVLWPKYTPSGGVNSGSEVPTSPSNTLQSNNSNLVQILGNPFGYEIEPGIDFIPQYTDSALDNPFSGPHQEAFHHMAMRSNPGEKFEVTTKRGKTVSMSRRQIEKMGKAMLAPGEVERVLGRDNPKRRYVATEMGGYGYMGGSEDDIGIDTAHGVRKVSSKKQLRKLEREYGNQEAAQKLRPGERAYEVSYFDEYDRRGASTLMTGRPAKVRREAKKAYGKDLGEISEIKPGQMMSTWSNPGADGRYTPDELAAMKVKAVALLDKKVPHAQVREQLGLTFPKYMAVLRSGTTKRGAPTHVPDSPSHFLRMPVQDRKDKRKQAVAMLKAGTKHEDVRKHLGVGYKTYLGILRTIPNPHLYDGYHEMMSNPAMMRHNPFGG